MFRDTEPPEEARRHMRAHLEKMEEDRARHHRATGRKVPVDAFPGDLLFFIRVTEVMHGLGARLRVRTPYLAIVAPYARQALVERFPAPAHVFRPATVLSPLEQKVRALLADFIDKGQIVGCQVCVYKDGRKVVDTAAGWRGATDRRPVNPGTVFCGLRLGNALGVAAVHLLVARGKLRYDEPVAAHWPAFAAHGKGGITVRQLLAHQAWLQHALPHHLSIRNLGNPEMMLKAIEDTKPLAGLSPRSIFHPYQAWLLAGLVQHASGTDLRSYVLEEIARPLDVEDELRCGLDAECGIESWAELSYEIPADFQPDSSGSTAGIRGDDGPRGASRGSGRRPRGGRGRRARPAGRPHTARGKQYLLDPRMLNHREI
eukprot:TRINITY_DN3710_c0_g1_i1.p1 TRINITY_DN3710_c0_g1~~TRINITY_DN3710_c0_g1_i1.p1  ORF type:complete len:373 (+),score=36.86 TRINITY_DN3710_c0_g1_i1:55-1173(+)